MTSWGFAQIWNTCLEQPRERELAKRDYIWASELGGSLADRFLKMKGIRPTNPPNNRSRRKFEAGNIWEYIVSLVLLQAGILVSQQKRVEYQYKDLLPVSGRLDFVAGGMPEYEKSKSQIVSDASLPPFIRDVSRKIIESFQERYSSGLKEVVLEIKSCSSFMFEVYGVIGKPNPNHKLQNFHYLKGLNMPEGHVVYVCREDARIAEYGVMNPSSVEEEYREDIEAMTEHVKSDKEPKPERMVLYDEELKKFKTNYKVAYSDYLTLLYGFKNQKEYEDTYRPKVDRWNRVLTRIRDKKEMTKNNLEAIEEIKQEGLKIPEEIR